MSASRTKTAAQECYEACSDYSCIRAGHCMGFPGANEGKHPDCSDRCMLREHKGYITCSQAGRCQLLEDK